jgi:hypothetical protein
MFFMDFFRHLKDSTSLPFDQPSTEIDEAPNFKIMLCCRAALSEITRTLGGGDK